MRCATALFALLLAAAAPTAAFAGAEPYLGEIATFGYRFCPRGWAPLDGQLLPISQNLALFALLGFKYGGDGKTVFALPTAKPPPTLVQGAPMVQCIAVQGIFPPRQ